MSQFFFRNVPILTFHKVDPRFEWGVTRVTPHQYKSVLTYLRANKFQTISLSALCNSSESLPENPIVITFDDAYESVYKYACPMMIDFGLTATFFVVAGYVGHVNDWDVNLGGRQFRHMDWPQIREMSKLGFEFGSHTINHYDLRLLPFEKQKEEIVTSKEELENRIGKPVDYLSFPFGRYNEITKDTAKEAGYKKACTFRLNRKDRLIKETFVLQRVAYYLLDNRWTLSAKLKDTILTPFEIAKLGIINFCSYGTIIVKSQCNLRSNSPGNVK